MNGSTKRILGVLTLLGALLALGGIASAVSRLPTSASPW